MLTGHHGLISSMGEEWQEQRRFALRHLKDFGFGRSKMEDLVLDEYKELAAELCRLSDNGNVEMESKNVFNLTILNVLWRIVMGKRFDMNDVMQKQRIEKLQDM